MKKSLSLVDASFLNVETRDTPMHVASLQIFKLPMNADQNFVKSVVESYRSRSPDVSPWNSRVKKSLVSKWLPSFEEDTNIDMHYHVRHTCLPHPGGERELGELVSHLHGQQLDRSRPLWTCHIIEGLDNKRFAIYTKIHHALTDGIRGIHLATRCLAKTPDGQWTAPWHWENVSSRKHLRQDNPAAKLSVSPADVIKHLPSVINPNFRRSGAKVSLPFSAPRTVLNTPITAARRVATQSLEIARIKSISERIGVSTNDVFLSLCSAALRRHLLSIDALPAEALIAGVPVSLREPGNTSQANAVGFFWANLATDARNAIERTLAIHASMTASKTHLQGLPRAFRSPYTIATMSPMIAVLMSGLGGKLPPPMNTTISNVPGPAKRLYLNGAELDAVYPLSIPFQGQGLNITCINYAGQMNVSFVGSRDKLPHLQHLAVYLSEALEELEGAVSGINQPSLRKAA